MYCFSKKINTKTNNYITTTADEILEYVKKHSEGYEIINKACRPYFDYDFYYETEEKRKEAEEEDIKKIFNELNTIYDTTNALIFVSHGIDKDKQDKNLPCYKNSFNIIIRGCGYYQSNNDINKPNNGSHDENVYKKNQKLRLPFASKIQQQRFKNILYNNKIFNINNFNEIGLKYEDLLITNITGEVEITIKEDIFNINDLVELSEEEEEEKEEEEKEEKEEPKENKFHTVKEFKHLLLCLKIDRIDNMDNWLVLMRICKNILNTFDADDFNKAKSIIHKHMKQTPEKYKYEEVEGFLLKPDEDMPEKPATWGSLAKMAREDNLKHYEKLIKKAEKIKKKDIFNKDRLNELSKQDKKYYWSDYTKLNNRKFKTPDEVLKYMLDSCFKIMNGGKPYHITNNKQFYEKCPKTGKILYNYNYKTIIHNPFSVIKNHIKFKIANEEYELYKFSEEYFKHYHFMSAEMLPYPGLNDPFKDSVFNDYKILNKFEGFYMAKYKATKPGVYNKMIHHIKNIICAGDEIIYNYVMGWLAWLIQKPDIKHETALLIHGIEGAGKNIFVEIVKRILGETICFDTYDINDIIGQFNANLSGKLLVVGDELVGYAGYKKSDFIKGMLTSPNIGITKKGVDTMREKSFQRYIFTTNNDETLRISENDRRLCVLGVLDTMKGNFEYFSQLKNEMNDLNNIKALFDYLGNFDLSNYDFRKAPETKLKNKMVENQLDDIYNWIKDYTETMNIIGQKLEIKADVAYESYTEYTNKNIRRKDFTTKLIDIFKCGYIRKSIGRVFVFNVDTTNNILMEIFKNNEKVLGPLIADEIYDSDDEN